MFREIVFFATAIAFCESACYSYDKCEYKGQQIEPGKDVLTEKDCLKCYCLEDSNLSSMGCCDTGMKYETYPETCKIVKGERDCEMLVLKQNESIECTSDEGEIGGFEA